VRASSAHVSVKISRSAESEGKSSPHVRQNIMVSRQASSGYRQSLNEVWQIEQWLLW
jgi:hypothetical protein